ncbi:SHOCT domain-containing protein [Dissulfurirhabdus thermomarina]|uniref:SHOCT domain-containing protein n=1 Tax=Dissulfurirhabdus thermomarina TaxID=1765737 RepID=A0A6N9TVL6_DISTH|nr:SHOCT domain-containing protein [Dissulfurirhabdus thermomarina]NDY43467.1 SHOCT domain-containing protein [Dissulfurirhabdus thermomarina]NMX23094.1 SHOCT domain-containing protein [Dissulfurirhabdus thermomarina]
METAVLLGFAAGIVVGLVLAWWRHARSGGGGVSCLLKGPARLLRERFERGEITRAEYEAKMRYLAECG